VVAVSEDGPPALLVGCALVSDVHNRDGIDNEESTSAAIYLCRAPAAGWAAAWPTILHLDS